MKQAGVGAVILAGGLSTRFGGTDKTLADLAGKPLIAHVLERLAAQTHLCVISANNPAPAHLAAGVPVIADAVEGQLGPLAGILSALEWFSEHAPAIWAVVSCAADTPFIPSDLMARLAEARARHNAQIVMARSGGASHPTVALWPTSLAAELRDDLLAGTRKVGAFAAKHALAYADFEASPFDPFFNINTQEDLALARDLLAKLRASGEH